MLSCPDRTLTVPAFVLLVRGSSIPIKHPERWPLTVYYLVYYALLFGIFRQSSSSPTLAQFPMQRLNVAAYKTTLSVAACCTGCSFLTRLRGR